MKGKKQIVKMAFAIAFAIALSAEAPAQAAQAQGGWIQNGAALSWIGADGAVLTDAVTPDGYYVNAAGLWQPELRVYLGAALLLPDQFLSSAAVTDLRQWKTWIEQLNVQLQALFHGTRIFHMYEDHITYSKVENESETVLLALYRDPRSEGWKVKVSCRLSGEETDKPSAASVDYVVLQYLLALVSHTPESAADAVFQSWEGENLWNLQAGTLSAAGDCMITYAVENGAAVYSLTRRL